jgi:hypothetical protein
MTITTGYKDFQISESVLVPHERWASTLDAHAPACPFAAAFSSDYRRAPVSHRGSSISVRGRLVQQHRE